MQAHGHFWHVNVGMDVHSFYHTGHSMRGGNHVEGFEEVAWTGVAGTGIERPRGAHRAAANGNM